jgi:hypothetical protein
MPKSETGNRLELRAGCLSAGHRHAPSPGNGLQPYRRTHAPPPATDAYLPKRIASPECWRGDGRRKKRTELNRTLATWHSIRPEV